MKYCIKCGIEIPQGAVYCGNCGYKIESQVIVTGQNTKPPQVVDKTQQPLEVELKPQHIRELRLHHMILTAFFGWFYVIPAVILLFRNNPSAVKVLIFGATIESIILLLLMGFRL